MERYESKHVQILQPASMIYGVLSDFSHLTPVLGDKVEGWSATADTCSFKVQGFQVYLQMVEKVEPKLIKVTGAEGSPMDFTFWLQLVSVSDTDTRMRLVLDVKLPMMMKMMESGTITTNTIVMIQGSVTGTEGKSGWILKTWMILYG